MSGLLATPRFGLDSSSEVATSAHHTVGSSFAVRYLSRFTSKVLTVRELSDYRASGIDVVTVFEDGAKNALGGYDAGKADARFALAQARSLGMPRDREIIYFAVDYDPAGAAHLTDPYFDGVAAVLGHANTGPYGGKEIITHCANRGFARLWQTYAWSGTPTNWDARAQLRQYSNGHTIGGVGVDFDRAIYADFGQWHYQAPAAPDPQHYGRFPVGPFAWKGRLLHERATVIEYDHLRRHPFLHRPRLHVLRVELRELADRVWFEAHDKLDQGAFTLPPTWGYAHRGWRYQELAKRANGARRA